MLGCKYESARPPTNLVQDPSMFVFLFLKGVLILFKVGFNGKPKRRPPLLPYF